MRVARVLGEGEALYHIISRIVDRRLILDDAEKERFRRIMRAVEAFKCVQHSYTRPTAKPPLTLHAPPLL